MLSIHINLSAGAQNITGAYIIILLVYRCLLTMHLPENIAKAIVNWFVKKFLLVAKTTNIKHMKLFLTNL